MRGCFLRTDVDSRVTTSQPTIELHFFFPSAHLNAYSRNSGGLWLRRTPTATVRYYICCTPTLYLVFCTCKPGNLLLSLPGPVSRCNIRYLDLGRNKYLCHPPPPHQASTGAMGHQESLAGSDIIHLNRCVAKLKTEPPILR